ncbi:F-box/WD repeat-containing protein 10 isoform X2 [Archocentrus centrarchus]|uniref:F-box/WD repeat-containing protein 10 isoform X2 n=1 Tax=Archocentrus centrarchus TaxID=63155 RepID=UPI0011E9C622|nr:F-box/WD repeat-containing protein 10-like isoform X2 [Archocentrus centrarchus]
MFVVMFKEEKQLLPVTDVVSIKYSTYSIDMEFVSGSKNASAEEANTETAEGCLSLCGMCPSCVFAPKPPGSSRCLWKVSDEFKRRFMLALLLRCRSVKALESIQGVLRGATSWTLHTYARSRRPLSPPYHPFHCSQPALDGEPLGVNVKEIWQWFSSSPDWVKLSYVCRIFSRCDSELLQMVSNLTNVLLVRQKRGFLQLHVSNNNQEESEDPALMVVPGSSKSVSGVSRHRDFISCLPVDLSKRILGLLGKHTLMCCMAVCRYWQHLVQETLDEMKFRRNFQGEIISMMKRCSNVNTVSPTYANTVEVPVPRKADDEEDIQSAVHELQPFKSAYANIRTTAVQMEERNVYCGAYFTKVLLDNEDPHRVLDYRGGPLMATGSKDRLVRLLYVASQIEDVSVLKGHVGSIRAVLLREDRDLLITASSDASIRCWNLKTDRCDMALYGHSGAINCLDADADRLVSGAKDCAVKVWCLQTGKHFDHFNFKHPSPVLCVKISKTAIYSSCKRGLIRKWDMGKAALLRVIDAHRSAVKCLFLDERHLLSGDSSGKVMAWSINHNVEKCLMTFGHQKEVRSLTLVYLRVVTGCVDGKIRIFNFLTGDCLREITAETVTGRILSLHFLDQSSPRGDHCDSLVSEKSAASLTECADVAQPPSTAQKISSYSHMKPKRVELLHQTPTPSSPTKRQTQPRARSETANPSVMLSEKAASERIKKRGLHHPLTQDCIHLRVNAVQTAHRTEEAIINMESNARLRDSWGPHTERPHDGHPSRAKTCVPVVKRAVTQNMTKKPQGRDVSTALGTTRRAL